jgi:hypothetical protein
LGDLDPKKLRTLADIAEALWRHALALGEEAVHPSLGVTNAEIATLAAHHIQREIGSCPACGAEPFVNIDCVTCEIADRLTRGELP